MVKRSLLALAISLLATAASAAITFEPPNPVAGQPVIAHVAAIGCPPTAVSSERHGNIISITVTSPECFAALPFEVPVNLGPLPAGVYDVVAGPPTILVAIAEGTLVVRDAAPPFDVVPNIVSTGGGQVHLRALAGAQLYKCFDNTNPVVCDLSAVKIGGKTVQIVSATNTDIVVTAPPHDAGAVDVSIVHNDGSETTATAALDYFDYNKPDAAFFEPVVFPVMVNGDGALGSKWQTALTMRNDNDTALPIVHDVPPLHCLECSLPLPHTTFTIAGPSYPGGFAFYVPRTYAPKLWFQAIARDLSRQSESYGTDIPVVREKDLYGRPFELLNVPVDPKFRVSLRALRVDGGNTVRLRIYSALNDDASAQPLVDTTLALSPGPFPPGSYTSGAILDLSGQFAQRLGGQDRVRIVIDGQTSAPVTWGFVSVTNNQTQQITIIAPH